MAPSALPLVTWLKPAVCKDIYHSLYFFIILFILFLAALGFLCCVGFSLGAASRGYSLVTVGGLLVVVASLAAESSLIGQLVKNPPAMQETPVQLLGWEDPLEKGKATHSSILGPPCRSAGKESTRNAVDLGSIPGLARSPGEGKGYPLQYSGLENSMDCIVHRVTKS